MEFVCNGVPFEFCVKATVVEKHNKKVYIGYFENSAPEGVEPGKQNRYCLKRLSVTSFDGATVFDTKASQSREYLELLEFEGEHIRQLLCVDDTAREFIGAVKSSSIEPGREYVCSTIEPVYGKAEPSLFTAAGKIELLLQMIEGIEEMKSRKNTSLLPDLGIIAHRDLKYQNVMLQWSGTQFIAKLIDFASLKLDSKALSTATGLYPLSPSNTAPENLLDYESVGESSDVFSLGMLLAEAFCVCKRKDTKKSTKGQQNPLAIWLATNGVLGNKNPVEAYTEQFERIKSSSLAFGDPATVSSWLELDLAGEYTFEFPYPEEKLRRLFFDATRFAPEDRISLAALKAGLSEIHRLLLEKERAKKIDVYMVDCHGLAGKKAEKSADYYKKALALFSERQESAFPLIMLCKDSEKQSIDGRETRILSDFIRHDRSFYPVLPADGEGFADAFRSIFDFCEKLPESDGQGYNGLGSCILKLLTLLDSDTVARDRLSGNVYVFTESIPDGRGYTVCDGYDVSEDCDRAALLKAIKDDLRVFAFAEKARCADPFGDGSVKAYTLQSDRIPEIKEKEKPAPIPENTPYSFGGSFIRGDGALFIRNSRKAPVCVARPEDK